jgi:hypothetical protein
VSYDKAQHGVLLTSWLIGNSPGELVELGEFLTECLDSFGQHL